MKQKDETIRSRERAKALKRAFLSAVMAGDMERAIRLKSELLEHNPTKCVTVTAQNGGYELDGQHFTPEGIKKHLKAQQRRFKLSGVMTGAIEESRSILAGISGPGAWFLLPDNNRGL